MAKYQVTISQTWSEDVIVNAESIAEAKRKAWIKWHPKKANYRMNSEREPNSNE